MRHCAPLRISQAAPLVLGSGSPRRRELLSTAGVPVVVRVAAINEMVLPSEEPGFYLERVTREKLEAVRTLLANEDPAPLLVADTIVVSPHGSILGKPADDEEAQAAVETLANASHEVRTRFVLATSTPRAPAAHAQTVITRVSFRALADGEARAYAATGEGRDKAGGYAAQGRAASFITRIEGSYTSVVGLPICEVVVALRALGWW
jgi:septum formation protein